MGRGTNRNPGPYTSMAADGDAGEHGRMDDAQKIQSDTEDCAQIPAVGEVDPGPGRRCEHRCLGSTAPLPVESEAEMSASMGQTPGSASGATEAALEGQQMHQLHQKHSPRDDTQLSSGAGGPRGLQQPLGPKEGSDMSNY